MAETLLRRVRREDAALVRRVRLRALASDPASYGSTYEREAAYPDERWTEWAAGDAEGEQTATWLALARDEPVGIVSAYRRGADADYDIFSMWVAPERRGEGLGRRLLEAIEAWIASSGGKVAHLSVTTEAPAARRLYERAGYEPDGHAQESRHTPGLIEVGLRKRLSN